MNDTEFKEIIYRRFMKLIEKHPLMKSVGGEYVAQASEEIEEDVFNFIADMCDTLILREEVTTW